MFHRGKLGGHSFRVSCFFFVSRYSLYRGHIKDSTCIPRKWELETWDFRFGERCLTQCPSKPFVEAAYGNDACLCDTEEKKSVLCQQESNVLYRGLFFCEDSVFILRTNSLLLRTWMHSGYIFRAWAKKMVEMHSFLMRTWRGWNQKQ